MLSAVECSVKARRAPEVAILLDANFCKFVQLSAPGEQESRLTIISLLTRPLVRRFFEEPVKGNLDVIDELLSPDFVDRSLMPGQGSTREDLRRSIAEIHEAFSTTSYTIVEQIAEDDRVVTKYRESSISRDEIWGLPPTGTESTHEGIYIHRLHRGKITEEWSMLDARPEMEDLAQEIRERERLEQELQVARSIQRAALPKEVPAIESWQITPYYQPAREVGGDFYEFLELDNGRVSFAVGDATGKGVPAAFVMSATCALLGGEATASGVAGTKSTTSPSLPYDVHRRAAEFRRARLARGA